MEKPGIFVKRVYGKIRNICQKSIWENQKQLSKEYMGKLGIVVKRVDGKKLRTCVERINGILTVRVKRVA